jgi:C4-dicarboxylate-specific signal transduction histidine kinase
MDQKTLQQTSGPFSKIAQAVIRPYGTAVTLVAIAFVLTFLMRRLTPYPFPFLFFGAVMASAWFGGPGAGLFSVLISTAVVDYFFVPPYYSFAIDTTNATYFGAFAICALVSSWVSSSMKKSEGALREARDHLEVRVAERTTELQNSNAELRRIIQEHDKAQQSLMKTQAELAHLSRVLSMGELTASIAHEINQPLTAVVTHGHACLEWVSADPPNVAKVRQTAESIIRDGTRAGTVLGRIRSLFKKEPPAKEWLNVNDVIEELTVFLRDEAIGRGILIRTELSPGLPRIKGDRVQLQQVVLNLILNGMDAMTEMSGPSKEMSVGSRKNESEEIVVSVEDSGVGLPLEIERKIFDPFFTTKPQGVGMGLSISRSIIESHHGRLWAERRPSGGSIFQFAIPVLPKDSNA